MDRLQQIIEKCAAEWTGGDEILRRMATTDAEKEQTRRILNSPRIKVFTEVA